jgi:hypothetical protein
VTDDLEAYFAAERAFEEVPSPEVRRRIRAGVSAALPSPGGGGGGGIPIRKAALGMLGTFALGGVLGAAAMHASQTPAKIAAPSPVVVAAPASAPPPVADAPSAVTIELPSVLPSTRPSASTPTGESIAAERALLDAARVELANAEPQAALDRVERHAKEFPHGRLVEEREAIAVRCLVKVGRNEEARQRGAAFKARWPRSLALPAVEAAMESIR